VAAQLTQEKNDADNRAAATAEIMRANAQATLNSANATLNAARTQDQSKANVIAAQIAETAEILRARAQATLSSAESTRSAALTQDAIQQTQVQFDQQVMQAAAGTQTAVANLIATQTQAALATSQFYADQSQQLQQQRRGSIAFLWTWCFPVFLLVLAVLILWGLWRWLKIRQANQRILENPTDRLPPPMPEVIDNRQDNPPQYLEGDVIDRRYQLTKPVDQARRWLDEVKRKLQRSDQKDEDDKSDD